MRNNNNKDAQLLPSIEEDQILKPTTSLTSSRSPKLNVLVVIAIQLFLERNMVQNVT